MITFFSIPKPWDGRIGTIQENAVRSWRAVDGASIVLCGSEPGVAEAAARLGVLHLPDLLRSPIGTPRLDDALERVEQVAAPGLRCFVNADIVVPRDLGRTVEAVERLGRPSIVAGQTLNLEVEGLVDVGDPQQGEALSTRAAAEGIRRGPTAIDYFVFPAHHFDPMPPFLVGRAGFDNWMIREGRRRGLVVDATAAVTAVHQAHDYAHVAGGKAAAYYGDEASGEPATGRRLAEPVHTPRCLTSPDEGSRPAAQPVGAAPDRRDGAPGRLEARVPRPERMTRVAIGLLTLVPGKIGGSETHVRSLCAALAVHGTEEVEALVSRLAPDAGAGLRTRVVRAYPAGSSAGARLAAYGVATLLPGVRREMALERYDVVHFPLTAMVPPVSQPATVVTVHDVQHLVMPEYFSTATRLYRRLAYTGATRRATRIVAISSHVAETLVERLAVLPERVSVVHSGINHAWFSPDTNVAREQFLLYPSFPGGTRTMHDCSRPSPSSVAGGPSLRLVLTGPDVLRSPRSSGIDVRGFVALDELVSLYRRASALVFPCLYEGFGQPLLEAMACGCPVAASDAAAIPEISAAPPASSTPPAGGASPRRSRMSCGAGAVGRAGAVPGRGRSLGTRRPAPRRTSTQSRLAARAAYPAPMAEAQPTRRPRRRGDARADAVPVAALRSHRSTAPSWISPSSTARLRSRGTGGQIVDRPSARDPRWHAGYPALGGSCATTTRSRPEIVRVLERRRPPVLVITGWSTFASQAAIVWCRRRRVPYVLQVESHDTGPGAAGAARSRARRPASRLRGAAGVLVDGDARARVADRARSRSRPKVGVVRQHDRRRPRSRAAPRLARANARRSAARDRAGTG